GFYRKPAIHSPARPGGLRGKIKEEAFAAGGCRRTFAPKACRSRRARQIATRRAIRQEGPSQDLGEEPKKNPPPRGKAGNELILERELGSALGRRRGVGGHVRVHWIGGGVDRRRHRGVRRQGVVGRRWRHRVVGRRRSH